MRFLFVTKELLILSVDTATPERSVAVTRGELVLALHRGDTTAAGSASVLVDIDAALRQAGVKIAEIELFAAAAGPGSFTGLRAGLATLKAFSHTLGRPVVGVPTLHAIAQAARLAGTIVALVPAGRGEVFAQMLALSSEGDINELDNPTHVSPGRLAEKVAQTQGRMTWALAGGDFDAIIREVAEKFSIRIQEGEVGRHDEATAVWKFLPRVRDLSAHVASLALKRHRAGEESDPVELRAQYVRASDAELKEQCRAPN